MDLERLAARRTSLVDASGIRKVFDLAAKLENPVDLSIGQPDFPVPEEIKREAIRAIEEDFNHYTSTQGIPSLHRAVREDLLRTINYDPEELLITSGASGALLLSILALVDPGDEVIIFDPYFVMYKHLIHMAGGIPVCVDTYPDFRPDVGRISAAITPRTKLIIVNSPANPTGTVYTTQEIQALAQLGREKDILIISDEIYSIFSYD